MWRPRGWTPTSRRFLDVSQAGSGAQQVFGHAGDLRHAGMGDAAFHRDGVELLVHILAVAKQAILGLRALYFALAAILHRFAYLKYALALVLVFIGGKIIVAEMVGKIPSAVSLAVTFGLLAAGVLFSLWKTRDEAAKAG